MSEETKKKMSESKRGRPKKEVKEDREERDVKKVKEESKRGRPKKEDKKDDKKDKKDDKKDKKERKVKDEDEYENDEKNSSKRGRPKKEVKDVKDVKEESKKGPKKEVKEDKEDKKEDKISKRGRPKKDEKEDRKEDRKDDRKKDKVEKEKKEKKEKKEEKKERRVTKKEESTEDDDELFLDMDYIIDHTRNYDSLKVYLKRTQKGIGIFARTDIKKGNVVAYYKVKVFSDRVKREPVQNGIYTFSIYDKNEEKIKKFYGDICMESLEDPHRGAPFFGYLANEPSNGQKCNVYMDVNLKDNYKDRDDVQKGDFFIYKMISLRDITADEEICWYYGDHYDRDYEISDRTR